MTLSENKFDMHGTIVYPEEDVKEFLKELKEEIQKKSFVVSQITGDKVEYIRFQEITNILDKLVGEDLK